MDGNSKKEELRFDQLTDIIVDLLIEQVLWEWQQSRERKKSRQADEGP